MSSAMVKRLLLLLALMSMASVSACLKSNRNSNNKGTKADPKFNLVYFLQNPFAGNQNLAQAATQALAPLSLVSGVAQNLNDETLWALSSCQCTPNFSGIYLNALVRSSGALPQVLVPTVREEIKNNVLLKTFSATGLGSIINLFMNDTKIANEVRKGISEKISKSLPGGSRVVDDLQTFFDLYPSPYSNLANRMHGSPKSMSVSEQASKWAYIFSIENMWRTNPTLQEPAGYKDDGLQLLATAITLSEWTYAFGLDQTKSGQQYGGLTFDPTKGLQTPLTTFDPRKNSTGSGVISGVYSVIFPPASNLDLALKTKETWARIGASVPLEEQARVWASTGLAYQRMRPTARTAAVQSIFLPQSGMLPDDAHQLPMAFLPGMAALLDGPFIDAERGTIREFALVPGSSRIDTDKFATLRSVTRLSRALIVWSYALETMEQDRLPSTVATQIEQSRTKLKDTLRLSIQTILDRYVNAESPNSRLRSIGMVESLSSPTKPAMSVVAETLTVLAYADQTVFRNGASQTDFQKKVVGLFHWFAAEYLSDIATMRNNLLNSPEAVIHTHAALSIFNKYPQNIHQAPWLMDALRNTSTALSDWDKRVSR